MTVNVAMLTSFTVNFTLVTGNVNQFLKLFEGWLLWIEITGVKAQQTSLRVRNAYFFDFQRTPAPSSGLPMNSIPMDSKAFLSFLRVSTLPAGMSSPADSSRTIVVKAIPAFSANVLTVNPVIARAALIWLLVINLSWPYNRINDPIYKIIEFILEIKKCLWIKILHRIAQNT